MTGMGSAPPPGGPLLGNIISLSAANVAGAIRTQGIRSLDLDPGRFAVKVFYGGRAGPFTGETDESGFFKIPFVAANQPLTIVVHDRTTRQERVFQGMGSDTFSLTSFDFTEGVKDNAVTTLADSGPGSLREAVLNAKPGDSVTFGVTGKITLASQIVVDKSLDIVGPGMDKLTISGGGSTRVFHLTGFSSIRVSDLTVADGKAGAAIGGPNPYLHDYGGGILVGNDNSSSFPFETNVEFTRDRFANNSAPAGSGGGVYIYSEVDSIVTDCLFSENTAQRVSALSTSSYKQKLTVHGTRFEGNGSQGNSSDSAVLGTSSEVDFKDLIFSNNMTPTDSGGSTLQLNPQKASLSNIVLNGNSGNALHIDQGTTAPTERITVTGLKITNQRHLTTSGLGSGSVYFGVGQFTINGFEYSLNGGGIQFGNSQQYSSFDVHNLVAYNNGRQPADTYDADPLINVESRDFTMTNSTIVGNRLRSHLIDMFQFNSESDQLAATIQFSTITDNELDCNSSEDPALSYDGALLIDDHQRVRLKNSIVTNNTVKCNTTSFPSDIIAVHYDDALTVGGLISGGYNLVGTVRKRNIATQPEPPLVSFLASDQLGVTDPGLAALADNGGSTLTRLPLAGGLSRDAVPVSSCTDRTGQPIATDQRGVKRPQGPGCDIGAAEAN